jgi:signal transduction histidine kinase
MSPEGDRHGSRDPESAEDRLIHRQREVNQELVLSSLRAHEEADAADVREKALVATAELRERLLGILGHDLRAPLSAMTMGAGLLARGNLNDDHRRVVERLLRSADRMNRMISQILDFTRTRMGGGLLLDLKPGVDLGQVCQKAAEELALGTSVSVQCFVDGDVTGSWDADRLGEVISNIAGNAIEHAREGTGVSLHASGEGSDVVVVISNEGKPIPPDVLPFIFEPFRRAKQREVSKAGNLGLGLYIACEITRAHHGSLKAHSSEGKTTFMMRLPRHPLSPPGEIGG